MPKIIINDFRGGRNTRDALPSLRNNQSGDQENTWVENGALVQRRGHTVSTISISSLSPIPEQLKISQFAARSLLRLMIVGRVSAHSQRYLCYTDNGTSFSFAAYRAGTCSTSGSSTTVTGSGTAWNVNAQVGDYFIPSGGAANRITAVNSATEIIVTSAVNLSAGTAYQIIPAIAQGSPCAMATFDLSSAQNLYIVDGARAYRYDGTDIFRIDASPTLMPVGKILVPHKNYLFVLRHDNVSTRWCDIRDPSSWPSANSQTVTTIADPVRGAVVYGDYIVIFTRSRMFRLLGDTFNPTNPTYVLQEISVPPGNTFYFSRSAVVHQGVLKFLTADGWYAYAGGVGIEKISDIINTDVDNIRRLNFAAESMQDSAVAFVHKNRMYCQVPDTTETPSTTNNTTYVLDENGAWWKWPTANNVSSGSFADFALAQFTAGGNEQLMAGNNQTNVISVFDTGNSENTTAIGGTWTSKEFVFDKDVTITQAWVTMKKQSAGNLTVAFSIDRASAISFTCDMTAGTGTVIRRSVPIGRVGKAFRVTVSNSTDSQTFEVYQIEVEYEKSEAERA